MEQITLAIINLRTNKENAIAIDQIYLNKSPDFQRCYEAWDDKLRTRFVESIIMNRATNPIWTVFNDDEQSEEVLDGMHRITTALDFLNNQFPIKETYLLSLEKEKYKGKYFRDLSSEDRSRIRNYNFTLNKLDGSYRTDRDKLRDMYEILNRSSRTLNDYEFNKVILSPFYTIIEEYKDMFIQSKIFKQMKDSRGSVDTEIIEMIALSEELQGSWSSVHSLKEEWIKKTIGETADKVAQYVEQKGEDLKAKLLFMTKIIYEFSRLDFFSDNSKTDKRYYVRHYISYKFIVSRCVRWIHNIAMFHRVLSNIIAKFKRDILVEDIQTRLECTSRSSTFQKRLMEKIDGILKEEVHAEGSARLFSKKQIQDKLEEQENKCALCHLAISFLDKYEGDHIIPWTAGGKTLPENLQVVHRRCHQLK